MTVKTSPARRAMNGIPIARILPAFLFITVAGISEPARANGWEHLAIPRKTLLAALDSGDPHVMAHAAISVGVRGEARDVEPLLRTLDEADEEHDLRLVIYRALGQIGHEDGAPALIRAMETETRSELRATAALSLGAIGSVGGLTILLAKQETEDEIVRSRIIDALGAFDHPESVATLTRLSERDRDEAVRLRALHALGATGSDKATGPLLAALDATENPHTKAIIIDALGNIAPQSAAKPLSGLLETTDDPVLKVKLAAALGAIGGDGLLPTLTSLLFNESRSVQVIAVRSLIEAKAPETATDLANLYDMLAASRPPLEEAVPPRDAAAYLADLDLMRLAVRAMVETDPENSLASLLDAALPRRFDRGSASGLKLVHKAYELRRLAIYALGYTESTDATEFLQAIARKEDDPRLRAVAIRSLGVLGPPESHAVALQALLDDHPEVRWTAATVLGRSGQSEAVDALRDAARDDHHQVRLNSAESLGFLGDERAIPILEELERDDNNEQVRQGARHALVLLRAAARP